MRTSTNLSTTVTASSVKDKNSVLVSYLPEKAVLYAKEETGNSKIRFMGGWSPDKSAQDQFIQVEYFL